MKPTLYASLRSPFARRVRICLEELQTEKILEYTTELVDVFNPSPLLLQMNPLGRVPVYKTEKGEVLAESSAIIEHLKEKYSWHSLFLTHGLNSVWLKQQSSLSVGIMELTVQNFLESLRPVGKQMPEERAEWRTRIHETLSQLEVRMRNQTHKPSALTVADIDVAVAVHYLHFRAGEDTTAHVPTVREHFKRMSERPSFVTTAPRN